MARPEFTPPDSPKLKAEVFPLVIDQASNHDALTLVGVTKFPYRSDIKNILITGGAGFM
jgi:hypothetical protein